MMRRICKVILNNERYLANAGDLLLDWALINGVELPHDCRAGMCGACRVRLVEGKVFGGHEPGDDMIHACQARIVSDIAIVTEDVPDPVTLSGNVADIVRLAPDIAGVNVEVAKPLRSCPASSASCSSAAIRPAPTARPIRWKAAATITSCTSTSERVRKARSRRRSAATSPPGIASNCRAVGSAFLRRNHRGPIVLVAGGTGFAPMWSIAVAAIMEQPKRELTFIVGAEIRSLYIHAAFCRLALFPNVTIIPVVGAAKRFPGNPLRKADRKFAGAVAGCRGLYVRRAGHDRERGRIAQAAGARCYADPFVQEHTGSEQAGLMSRLTGWLNEPKDKPIAMQPARQENVERRFAALARSMR